MPRQGHLQVTMDVIGMLGVCISAAENGHLQNLTMGPNKWMCLAFSHLCNTQLGMVIWKSCNGPEQMDVLGILTLVQYATRNGHLEVLQWARTNGCPWNLWTCAGAARNGHLKCLQWARTNGCDWD